jgi:hypothetical protein
MEVVGELTDPSKKISKPKNKDDVTIDPPVISGSFPVDKKYEKSLVEAQCKHNVSIDKNRKIEGTRFKSKPRTALLQGREDDEPMAQIIEFGSVLCDGKENMMEGVLDSTATLPSRVVFNGSNLLKQKMNLKRIIIIGTMHVEVEWSPT